MEVDEVAEMPLIDKEKCQGCGLCVSVCSCGALVLIDNVATIVKVEECHWCTWCEVVCPNGAITCPFEIVIEKK
jgi:MinD superfamily P-loop ATPase